MGILFIVGVFVAYWAEAAATTRSPRWASGGNMEGKEVRFGIVASRLVCRHHHRSLLRRRQRDARQLHALGGMIPLINMQLARSSSAASAPASTACCCSSCSRYSSPA
jgi:K+-transporting ATPase ATPase A chain